MFFLQIWKRFVYEITIARLCKYKWPMQCLKFHYITKNNNGYTIENFCQSLCNTSILFYDTMSHVIFLITSIKNFGLLWISIFLEKFIRFFIAIYEAAVKRRGFYLCRDKFYWCREAFMDVERQFNAVVLPRDVHKGLETPVKSCRGRG